MSVTRVTARELRDMGRNDAQASEPEKTTSRFPQRGVARKSILGDAEKEGNPGRVSGSTPQPSAEAPAAKAPMVRRSDLLSAGMDSDLDVRIACNAIKTLAPALAVFDSPELSRRVVVTAERMCKDVFEKYSIFDEEKKERFLPFLMPSMVDMLAEACLESEAVLEDKERLDDMVRLCAQVGASKQGQKLQPPSYNSDTADVDLRITLLAASSSMVNEIVFFRFNENIDEDIAFATKTILTVVKDQIEVLVPENASEAAAVMVTQSLIQNANKVFGTCWRRQAFLIANQPDGIKRVRTNPEPSYEVVKLDFERAMKAIISLTAKHVGSRKNDNSGSRRRRSLSAGM